MAKLSKRQVEHLANLARLKLSDKEKEVLEMRFGMIDGISYTLEDVGRHFKVTCERIRQIEAKALKKLRHHNKFIRLREYIESPLAISS